MTSGFSVRKAIQERILGQEYDWEAVASNIPYVLLGLGVIFGTILLLLLIRWVLLRCCAPNSTAKGRYIIVNREGVNQWRMIKPEKRVFGSVIHVIIELLIFLAMVIGVWVGVAFMGINFWTSPYATLAASIVVGYIFQSTLVSVGCGIAIYWTNKVERDHYYQIPGVVEGRVVDRYPTWVTFETLDPESGTTIDVMVNTTDVWGRIVQENYHKRCAMKHASLTRDEFEERHGKKRQPDMCYEEKKKPYPALSSKFK